MGFITSDINTPVLIVNGSPSHIRLKDYININAAVFGLEVDETVGINNLVAVNLDALFVQARALVLRARNGNREDAAAQFINIANKAGITLV